MKNLNRILVFMLTMTLVLSCTKMRMLEVSSPDGKTIVKAFINDQKELQYQVIYDGNNIIEPSKLGLIREDTDFSTNLALMGISQTDEVNDNYTLTASKKKEYSYKANKKTISVANKAGEEMQVIFQVSDNGVAFRYNFPGEDSTIKIITDEITQFVFDSTAKAWLQPLSIAKTGWGQSNPSYEEHYLQDIPVGTPSPMAGWVFPALFKTNDTWVLISESDVQGNYCGSHLKTGSQAGDYEIEFPDKREVIFDGESNPQSTLPWASPWRTITVGSLGDIVESSLVTDVASPAIEGNFSWVKSGRSSWSWVILKDDFITYPVQKKFIDYSSEMGWEYCLIDNYWDTKIGYEKIQELSDYAAEKDVKLILWYNSAGDWNTTPQTPKDSMLTEKSRMATFTKLKEMGISGVKVDFFGGDGQSVMAYYHAILKSAAEAGIMVNFHGCTYPRGWQRTYPNLMTMESIKGMEFTTFSQADQDPVANHCSMMPFTRNVYDPMDFTPTCFGEIPHIKRVTTNGFEIALPVLFISGIQHFAEIPEVMLQMPGFVKEFMSTVPVAWDDTKFIDGYPGEFVVIARKSGNAWYVAGINGKAEEKEIELDLSFIENKEGFLIADGATNRELTKKDINITDNANLSLTLKPNGGFVMKF